MKDKTLVIWMENGTTCFFERVKILKESANSITFEYFGVSTQTKREATFCKHKIAGYAIEI
ncbi:hypothetical protein AJGP001_10830 [Planococcus faecalis]|uniref:Uncharacterized protein n=1 Tax=Planococcus faecalis TaxID=1598147 RepID=A0ABM6IT20_9BACL|nr:hypothetical protein [Planococcus faecalis]AQU79727.1 hypothetical protein AJGP001_10830 [Planococcus faecalis]